MPQPTDNAVTIMIVDDHAPMRAVVRAFLAMALPECRILEAGSAELALQLCACEAPAIVVLDIALPGMNGIEAARQIKTMMPAIHVVMHSSHDTSNYREICIAAGASAFVPKDRGRSDLLPAIAALLPLA